MNTPWVRKYQPKKAIEVVGQDAAMRDLTKFVLDHAHQKKKAALIYGPSGVGKTSAVHAIAQEQGIEILEINASDTRNKDSIDLILGNALKQRSLFSTGKIVLVDEIDGITGMEDRGGVGAIAALIEKSAFPVVMTAQNPFDSKFTPVRSKSNVIQFQSLEATDVFTILKQISIHEKVHIGDEELKTRARRAGGDARAAVNDLQSLASDGKTITQESVDTLSERDQTQTMASAMLRILKTTDPNVALSAFDNVEEDIDKQLLWLDENVAREYEGEDLARAYDCLSKADVFKGRIRRWQHWRFLVYINALMTAGVAVAKKERYKKTVNYEQPSRLLKIWMANQRYARRKSIAQKLGLATHSSSKRAMHETLPFVRYIIKKNKRLGQELIQELDLDSDEAEWIGR
jgi:replication factor C large subunit